MMKMDIIAKKEYQHFQAQEKKVRIFDEEKAKMEKKQPLLKKAVLHQSKLELLDPDSKAMIQNARK